MKLQWIRWTCALTSPVSSTVSQVLVFYLKILIVVVVVRVDEESISYVSPLQESITRACQQKFHLPPVTRSFSPDQVYVTMMELCPLWVHGRILGRRLYHALWGRMSDYCFACTELGHFTWLAIALKQEVYVCYDMQQLLPVGAHVPNQSAVLDSLDPVYDRSSDQVLWKAKFCLEIFDVVSVTGPVSYLVQLFSNPRPMPVYYSRRTHRADHILE